MSQEPRVIAILAACSLALLGGTSWWSSIETDRLARSRESLQECLGLAARLAAARESPETTAAARASEDELSQRFEAWSREAGLRAEQVEQIDPRAPRRLADTDYLIEGADIELSRVSLAELAKLASLVERSDRRLRFSSLRLSAPREDDGAELWQAELALTYLRHAPRSR